MRSSQYKGWGLIAPTLCILGFVGLAPFLYVIYLSVFRYNVFSRIGMVYRGIDNFRELMFDPDFMHALKVGLTFVACTCAIEIPLGLLLALLLSRKFVGRGVFRTIFTLPLAVAPLTIGSLWVLITNPDMGPFPYILRKFSFEYNIGFYRTQAFFTTVAMDVWHWTPFVTLTLLAGLTALPREPFESAVVDGADKWQILRYLTLPLLKPIMLLVLFIRIMDTFKIFDEVWMLTSGGPGTATRYVSIHIVRLVLSEFEFGYGSSMSLFILYLTIAMCWLLFTITMAARRQA